MTKYFLLEELSLLYMAYEQATKNDEIFEVRKKIRERIKEVNQLISNMISSPADITGNAVVVDLSKES